MAILHFYFQICSKYCRMNDPEYSPQNFGSCFGLLIMYFSTDSDIVSSCSRVIYKMTAGRTLFAGNTTAETFANLINSEPQTILAELFELAAVRNVPPYHIALIYQGLGERENTLEWLEKKLRCARSETGFLKSRTKMEKSANRAAFYRVNAANEFRINFQSQ